MQMNPQTKVELFVPAHPEAVYAALMRVATEDFKRAKGSDFTRAVTFRSGASMLTWGQDFHAQVTPAEGGSKISVSAVGRNGGNYQHGTRSHRLIAGIMERVTELVQEDQIRTA
ncbi:hypothetical protein ACFFGR_09145 [Arthrobacter liuii]|uniref:DUF1499 domain-containing protein n=1 Tax=Arthrobacter liuii TaxID=1476996 RepID=A0ABQ2AP21_9MICC|nr:hypothetical protein [Arthrobacter liuii]GGH93730.1 hypothetical protein GCM10007170_15280 [Arthrobacter liuii]